ncbi:MULTISPECIES: hypothetical protein [Halolamina]|uniref:Uncharacterized protein n=1 Tax=Halolamina pelagica TaxID=699431 RepID=A0A1I5NL90_9EURY|nr:MULTISPECIES: hypothetical protein [Halolamina]NHX36372.1 hypothetical protein [Halolamina sp. R1-12]SFP22492.1 hypothetical protein SAMN05216277_10286 [Halolamina pelagica]
MIEFETAERGLRVVDTVEEVEYVVNADGVSPAPATTDQFPAPIDAAVHIRTDRLSLPTVVDYHLRDAAGSGRRAVAGAEQSVTATTFVEATNTPMKLYLRIDPFATVATAGSGTRISFDGPSTVLVGARSPHRRPAGTVTVPKTPAGVARGVSLFASALKTTSPERSFPTLRGHPPMLEFGEAFDADGIERPATGIEIRVPDDYASVFSVAPLSYYLGAAVRTGAAMPELVAGDETVPLRGELGEAAADTLRHCFLLDCVARTEGLYPVSLRERAALADRTAIDPERWYEMPIDRRTAAYLSVPRDATEDLLDWHLTADVEPAARNAAILPFVADDLAIVRSPTPLAERSTATTEPDELEEFFRADDARGAPRGSRTTQNAHATAESVRSPVETDTYGHVWVGEQFPMGASKPTVDAYRRRLGRQPTDDSTTTVTLVCNDEAMLEEIDEELYGFFDMLTFEVRRHNDLTKRELRSVLRTETSFLHYVGHVEDEGVQCADGYLDLGTLSGTGVEAFLLNGCRSYEQGQALVDAGAFGGVATLTSVSNAKATTTGRHLARLLDAGFDFHGALDVIRRIRISRQNYVVVGDGRVTISQSDSGTPLLLTCDERGPERVTVTYHEYPTATYNVGSMTRPYIEENGTQYLAVGEMATFTVTYERLVERLSDHRIPIVVDGELWWTNSVDLSTLRDRQ